MDGTIERIATYSAASNIKLSRPTMTAEAPVQQVQTDMAASVASSVTASVKKASSLLSVQTPQSLKKDSKTQEPNPVTPNLAKNIVKRAPPVITTGLMDTTQYPSQVNGASDLFNLGIMPESDDMELPLKDVGEQVTGKNPISKDPTVIDLTMTDTPADLPADLDSWMSGHNELLKGTGNPANHSTKDNQDVMDLDGFMTVMDGAKPRSTTTDNTHTVSKNSENSFAILEFEGELDEDNQGNNKMLSSNKLIDEDGKSLDLLAPAAKPRKEPTTNARRKVFETLRNMAPSPPTVGPQKPSATVPTKGSQQTSINKITQKQKQKFIESPIFQVADAKLRDHAYATQAIENKIL